MGKYDALAGCRLQRRYDDKVITKIEKHEYYSQPTREGNKAFPVFKRLKNSPMSQTKTDNEPNDSFIETMAEIVQENGKSHVKK